MLRNLAAPLLSSLLTLVLESGGMLVPSTMIRDVSAWWSQTAGCGVRVLARSSRMERAWLVETKADPRGASRGREDVGRRLEVTARISSVGVHLVGLPGDDWKRHRGPGMRTVERSSLEEIFDWGDAQLGSARRRRRP